MKGKTRERGKTTQEDILTIAGLIEKGISQAKISKITGLSPSTINYLYGYIVNKEVKPELGPWIKYFIDKEIHEKWDPVGELKACTEVTYDNSPERDKIALEAMKIFLSHQGTRTVTLLSKVKLWLGIQGWKQTFDYNFTSIAKSSYDMADALLLKSKKK